MAILLASFPASANEGGLESQKLTVKTFVDFGQIVNGSNPNGNKPEDKELSMFPLNRVNAMAIQDLAMGGFDVSVGLSALVWWPYDGGASSDLKQRIMNVKPMVPVARARWRFGDPSALQGSLQVGSFSYKYNPDARNLGEYLYRSGTYPGFIWTNEGWLLMNRAGSYSHGALLSLTHLGGRLTHNLSLFMETLYFPVGDFSPGYDFSLSAGLIDLGGGVVLNHYLPMKPSALERKNEENTYVKVPDVVAGPGGQPDTVYYYAPRSEVSNLNTVAPLEPVVISRWTSKGVKLMGRAAIRLGGLLPESKRSPEDLKVFAEVAYLGVENQPLFYEKPAERIPVMLGVNLPTFKLLDLLSLQVEHYKSPFGDIGYFNGQSYPIWKTTFEADTTTGRLLTDPSGKVIPKGSHRDDWKWSVHARKAFGKAITVYAQAASDHFRLTDADYRVTSTPLTNGPKEWYYLLRLEFTLR